MLKLRLGPRRNSHLLGLLVYIREDRVASLRVYRASIIKLFRDLGLNQFG